MKELELKTKNSCNCKSFCVINHSVYNWTKCSSDELVWKMQALNIWLFGIETEKSDASETNEVNRCGMCEQEFHKVDEFVNHIGNNHKAADVTFLQAWILYGKLVLWKSY